jgi:4-hydroxy-2-oxoheptanedioate aldolase
MRLNRLIRGLEAGEPVFANFALATRENAVALSESPYDGTIIEMEHHAFDVDAAQDFMQYLINPRKIAEGPGPNVTPVVRVAGNGREMNDWQAKQMLDAGVFGIVWPHIDTAEQAQHAVEACRYPQFSSTMPEYGFRGCAPFAAARYMSTTPLDYYQRAGGVWPLDPEGEIIVIVLIEGPEGVENIEEIVKVPGIGIVFIGPGDLSQAYGVYGQYDGPIMTGATERVLKACKEAGVACGITVTSDELAAKRVQEGFRFVVMQPRTVYPDVAAHKALAKAE